MKKAHDLLAGAATAAMALLAPFNTVAQEAARPVTQEMDFAPILLGIGAVALVVIAFVALSRGLRTARAQRDSASGAARGHTQER